MSGPEDGASREATLDAVHSDQLALLDQLRELGNIITQIEEHLLGSPRVQMMSAADAQAKASIAPGQLIPAQGLDVPIAPQGMLPQMCELGLNNSKSVTGMRSQLTSISRLLGVPNVG